MEYNALKVADKVIVTNRKIKELLIKIYKFLTFEDLVIIPHGYDAADFASSGRLPPSNKKMVLAYSGIFYEHNTPKHFFSAFNKLKKENPQIAGNIELHFIGDLGKSNLKLIKNYNLEEFVVNHGYLNHDEAIAKILSRCFMDDAWEMEAQRYNFTREADGIYRFGKAFYCMFTRWCRKEHCCFLRNCFYYCT
jgi:glycosyltransferase involved in cell wall biosynthesis